MHVDELLSRLDGVRRTSRGWTAKCPVPSHGQGRGDRRPSLSVSEGGRGVLLKCWAGCELEAICAAIGIAPRQMFFDDNGPIDREAIRRNQSRRQAEQTRKRAKGRRADAFRESESVIRAATGIDISAWSDEQLDVAMNVVCDAREFLLREDSDAIRHELVEA